MHPSSALSRPSPKRSISCAGLDDLDELLHGTDNASSQYHRKRHHSLNNDNNFTATSFASAASPRRNDHSPIPASYPGALRLPDLPAFSGKNSTAGSFYQTPPPSPSFHLRSNQPGSNQNQASRHHRDFRSDQHDNNYEENCEDFDDDLDGTGNDYGAGDRFIVSRLTPQQSQREMEQRPKQDQASMVGKRLGLNAFLPPPYRSSVNECSPREEFLVQAFGPTGFKLYGSPQTSKHELNNCYSGGPSNNNREHEMSRRGATVADTDADLKMSYNELEEDIRGAMYQQQQQHYQPVSKLPELAEFAQQPFSSSSHGHFALSRGASYSRSTNQEEVHHSSTFGQVHYNVQNQKEYEYVTQDQQHLAPGHLSPAHSFHGKNSGGIQTSTKWLRDEDERLRAAVARFGGKNWKMIAETLGNGRTDVQCLHRWNKVLKPGLIKGPWTPEEDRILTSLINRYGVGKIRWCDLALHLPGRIGKQCRERWCNHLDSRICKGQWTPEEDDMVFTWQQKLGNKWSEIAKMLPGRTENAVKNRFNSAARRKWLINQANKASSTPTRVQLQTQSQSLSQSLQQVQPASVDRSGSVFSVDSSRFTFGADDKKVAALPRPASSTSTASIAPEEEQYRSKMIPPIGHEVTPHHQPRTGVQATASSLSTNEDGSCSVIHPTLTKGGDQSFSEPKHFKAERSALTPPVLMSLPLHSLLPPPVPLPIPTMHGAGGANRDSHHLLAEPPREEAISSSVFQYSSHLPTLPQEVLPIGSMPPATPVNYEVKSHDSSLPENPGAHDIVHQSTPDLSAVNAAPDASVPMDDENMNSFLDSVALELDDIMG